MTKASVIAVLDDNTKTVLACEIHTQISLGKFEVIRLDCFQSYGTIPQLMREILTHCETFEGIRIRKVECATGDQYDISIIDINNPSRIHQYII